MEYESGRRQTSCMEGMYACSSGQCQDQGSPDDRALPSNIAVWGSQDIAICAFLMLLWKDKYPAREGQETGMAWDLWGRPPGGFVDLGCVSDQQSIV